MDKVDLTSIILNILILAAVGGIGLLIRGLIVDVKELKQLYVDVAEMKVKVDRLWGDDTNSGLGSPYPIRKRRSTDRDNG